jgi:hypothetical protein
MNENVALMMASKSLEYRYPPVLSIATSQAARRSRWIRGGRSEQTPRRNLGPSATR